jgi:hypothetical protein
MFTITRDVSVTEVATYSPVPWDSVIVLVLRREDGAYREHGRLIGTLQLRRYCFFNLIVLGCGLGSFTVSFLYCSYPHCMRRIR